MTLTRRTLTGGQPPSWGDRDAQEHPAGAAFAAAGMGSNLGQDLILQAAEDEIHLVARKGIGFSEQKEHS